MIWVLLVLVVLAWASNYGLHKEVDALKKEIDTLKWDLINENTIKPPNRQ